MFSEVFMIEYPMKLPNNDQFFNNNRFSGFQIHPELWPLRVVSLQSPNIFLFSLAESDPHSAESSIWQASKQSSASNVTHKNRKWPSQRSYISSSCGIIVMTSTYERFLRAWGQIERKKREGTKEEHQIIT